ncbi:unnamed protein product [Thelazia callipaeda]|uniref:ANK_REP_REGION domain-containing protein n=1 Tax=Thelazia callipaeda TaxID=103827 RepID=A0A158RCT1_THECL|nr:unnamed protein product [Thelazia callipaeda]
MTSDRELQREYPLHWAVFQNDYGNLMELLKETQTDDFLNKLDVRGRTPLMLAVTLGHNECARALLEKGASATIQNADMWSPSHEAICTGNSDLLQLIIQYRDYQRAVHARTAMERLLSLLKETGDFYAEMSWEFTSWLPFVSKMSPSDTYKIYKRGSNVRIDTTLVGFNTSSVWERGNQSFIFRFSEINQPQFIVLDHCLRTVTVHTMGSQSTNDVSDFVPTEEAIQSRMTSPVETTFVDVEKIGFERSKGGGLLSWLTSSDRTEEVDGYECKVFNASNVEIVTKTRTEHLLEEDKERLVSKLVICRFRREERENPLQRVLKLVEKYQECTDEIKQTGQDVYCGLTPQQYLDKNYSMNNRDIGRSKQVSKKFNSFSATLWLCERYPLNLQDQVLPIIDLMAVSNTHFARLKNFIQLQLPTGFPVKIEIPLFHVVSARITFSAINRPGPYVFYNASSNEIEVDLAAFEIPLHYRLLGNDDCGLYINGNTSVHETRSHGSTLTRYIPEDELYLQFALEQSMKEATGFPSSDDTDVMASANSNVDMHGDRDLAYAIRESLRTLEMEQVMRVGFSATSNAVSSNYNDLDDDLQLALRLSEKEEEERLKANKKQEEELERILKLSLTDK